MNNIINKLIIFHIIRFNIFYKYKEVFIYFKFYKKHKNKIHIYLYDFINKINFDYFIYKKDLDQLKINFDKLKKYYKNTNYNIHAKIWK